MITRNVLSKIHNLEYRQACGIMVTAIVTVLSWGIAIPYLNPEINDSFVARLFVGAVGIGSIILGSKFKNNKNTPSWMVFSLALSMISHGVYTAQINGWPSFYVLANYLILVYAYVHLTSRVTIYVWTCVFLSFTVYAIYQNLSSFPPVYMMITSVALMVLSIFSSAFRSRIFEELKRAEQGGAKILETMEEGLLVFSSDGELRHFNFSAQAMLGLQESQLPQLNIRNFLDRASREDGSQIEEERSPFLISLKEHRIYKNHMIRYKKTEGASIWLSMNIAPVLEEGVMTSILVTFQDVTSLKQNEHTIREQERMLSVKGRFNALGEMAAGIAHEINNPLAILSGRVEQIRRLALESVNEKQINLILVKIDSTIKRISRIIQSMKSLSREGTNDPFETAKLFSLIEDTMVLTKERLDHAGIRVEVHVDPSLELECRPAQLSQVFLNMLHNAKDAIESLPEKWIRISAEEIGDHIYFTITDSGSGIPESVRKKIMQPFFTTKEIGRGTGLGLSISTSIIQSHQGEILIDEKSQNTKFIITLPKWQTRTNLAA